MTKMMQGLQWMWVAMMAAGSLAYAQQITVTVPGTALQAGVMATNVAQVKDDLFGDTSKFAKGASEVTEINLDPSSMGLVGKSRGRDAGLARRMKTMVIHTYKYDKPGMYRMEDVDAYRKKLEDGSWSCSVHVRSTNGSTDICSRASSDHETNEMVILSAEPKELTFIHMSGRMSLGDLDQMGGSAGDFNPGGMTPKLKNKSLRPEPPAPPSPPAPPTPPIPPSN